MTDETIRGTLSRTLDALADVQRRCVLYYLREHETASVDTLADVVTGWVHASTDGIVSADQHRRMQLELYHLHLPHLRSAGLLEYDAGAGQVELADYPPIVDDLLDLALAIEADSVETSGRTLPWPGDDAGRE
jgi:hypothetical protein